MKTELLLLLARLVPALVLLSTTSGCVTRYLWEGTYFGASRTPKVEVFAGHDSREWVVAYDARVAAGRELGRKVVTVREASRRTDYSEPGFLPPTATNGLAQLPVLRPSEYDPVRMLGRVVVMFPGDDSFEVWSDGRREAECRLPYYNVVTYKPVRVLLTVPAVAADIAGTASATGILAYAALGSAVARVPFDPADFASAGDSIVDRWEGIERPVDDLPFGGVYRHGR